MNTLILGRRRHGKSTLAMWLAQKQGRPIVVYDINAQFRAWPESVVYSADDLHVVLEVGRLKLIIFRPDDEQKDFAAFAEELWDRQGYTLLVDEASFLQNPQTADPWLRKFIRAADPEDIGLIQTTHMPADLWGKGRGLSSDWYMFYLTRDADLRAVAEQCGEEVAVQVSKLGQREFVHYNLDTKASELVTDPTKWFVEINAGPLNSVRPANREGEPVNAY